MKRLILIDSHAIIHRAFHALPPLTAPDGTPTNAVYGFASILLKILKELKPDYVVAAFDHPSPTFRHAAFERYKAHRVKAPDALYAQIPAVKELLGAFTIPVIEKQGYEADDIIGTIAAHVRKKNPSVETIIVTGDLDTLQLVDAGTKVFTMRKGITDTVLYDEAAVRARYGLSPRSLIDFKGLRGDPSDNIPGVKGIGEKTAAELVQAYGSIEAIYQKLKKSELVAKPAVLERLKTHEADALFSKTLVTIDRNVPISFLLDSARLRKFSEAAVRPLFERFGFFSLLRRLGMEGSGEPEAKNQKSVSREANIKKEKSFTTVPHGKPAALVADVLKQQLAVAVEGANVFELPLGAIESPSAAAWFAALPRAYLWDIKSSLPLGLPFDPARMFDLGIVWWALEPGRRIYSPEKLIMRELGKETSDSLAERARGLLELGPKFAERLEREELEPIYRDIEAPLIPILYQMEKIGIRCNASPLAKLSTEMARELALLETRIHAAAGGPFNIQSPRQLAEVLFEKLKLAPAGIRKTERLGALSTRESELKKLAPSHSIIADVLRFREISKLKSTYADALPKLIGRDKRLHTTWNQTGTATGRLSSQNPNLQNIPTRSDYGREIRRAFVAERGFTFVAFDYSQLELRIAADLSEDEKMINAFCAGDDIHRLTAAEVNGIPERDVTPEQRYKAKALNFGILYGMGARAFAESAGISRDEANVFIEEYFKKFSGVARFIEATKEFARAHGFAKTAFGRKRFFPEILSTNFRMQREAERMAVNHPIQGTAADIVKRAMIEIARIMRENEWKDSVRLLLQVHDELFFEIKSDRVSATAPKIMRIMEEAWRGKVPLRVEIKQGANWGDIE